MLPAHEVFKKLGELGLLGLKYPEQYEGTLPGKRTRRPRSRQAFATTMVSKLSSPDFFPKAASTPIF
jgi:hypothetical protein